MASLLKGWSDGWNREYWAVVESKLCATKKSVQLVNSDGSKTHLTFKESLPNNQDLYCICSVKHAHPSGLEKTQFKLRYKTDQGTFYDDNDGKLYWDEPNSGELGSNFRIQLKDGKFKDRNVSISYLLKLLPEEEIGNTKIIYSTDDWKTSRTHYCTEELRNPYNNCFSGEETFFIPRATRLEFSIQSKIGKEKYFDDNFGRKYHLKKVLPNYQSHLILCLLVLKKYLPKELFGIIVLWISSKPPLTYPISHRFKPKYEQMEKPIGPYPISSCSLAFGWNGEMVVLDASTFKVSIFSAEKKLIASWGTSGKGKAQFLNPKSITVDLNYKIYVADYGNNRVQVFSCRGDFLKTVTHRRLFFPLVVAVTRKEDILVSVKSVGSSTIYIYSSQGRYQSFFKFEGQSGGFALDNSDNVHIMLTDSIRVYTLKGELLRSISHTLGIFDWISVDLEGRYAVCGPSRKIFILSETGETTFKIDFGNAESKFVPHFTLDPKHHIVWIQDGHLIEFGPDLKSE